LQGLLYLHTLNPTIVHGDLKGVSCLLVTSFLVLTDTQENVLVKSDGEAVLTDFGLSVIVEDPNTPGERGSTAGTLRWKAPELFAIFSSKSTASDVWGFGCTTYEVPIFFNTFLVSSVPVIQIRLHRF
jgi:serine/threonine protein kinase